MAKPTSLSEFIAKKTLQVAKTTYVILIRDKAGNATLVVDPGLDRPYSNKNLKLARWMAKQCGGEAVTWAYAYGYLKSVNPNFEEELEKRAIAAEAERKYLINTPTTPSPNGT